MASTTDGCSKAAARRVREDLPKVKGPEKPAPKESPKRTPVTRDHVKLDPQVKAPDAGVARAGTSNRARGFAAVSPLTAKSTTNSEERVAKALEYLKGIPSDSAAAVELSQMGVYKIVG